MKTYLEFINENLSTNQEKYLLNIVNYIKKNSKLELFEYAEDFIVNKKDGEKLTGKLFLTLDKKAIRFNFEENITLLKLHSIDLWENFEFDDNKVCNNPSYTMYINLSVVNVILDKITNFVNGNFNLSEDVEETPKIKQAVEEDVHLKSLIINKNVLNENLDVFDTIKMFTGQVAAKMSNGLIVSGLAGLGKSFEITETLDEMRADYVLYKGDVTTAGLFETLFLNRNKLVVFDDCDTVWEPSEIDSQNILKAALETSGHKPKMISRMIKTHFNSDGMTDKQIQERYEKTGKLPKTFNFQGQIIFITNKKGSELNPAIVSRCLHVDVNLNREQVLERMTKIMAKMYPNVPDIKKQETLEFLDYICSHYKTKFPLNIRTLIHAINIRISNDYKKQVGDEMLPVWMLLIKSFLVE